MSSMAAAFQYQKCIIQTSRWFLKMSKSKALPYALASNTTSKRYDSNTPTPKSKQLVTVVFNKPDGQKVTVKGTEGDSLLDVVVKNNIEFDCFGACEGTMSCSTCHVILKQEDFAKLDQNLADEEYDMLDLAYGITDTSRLGCQIILKKELEGVEVTVPSGAKDVRD